MQLSPIQEDIINAKICPYCKSSTKVISEKDVYDRVYKNRSVIACYNFPNCHSYVGCHDDGRPLGRLANKELRLAKKRAHYHFDQIWKDGYIKRNELYEKLSDYLNLPSEYTHIGMFSIETCDKVVIFSKYLLKQFRG